MEAFFRETMKWRGSAYSNPSEAQMTRSFFVLTAWSFLDHLCPWNERTGAGTVGALSADCGRMTGKWSVGNQSNKGQLLESSLAEAYSWERIGEVAHGLCQCGIPRRGKNSRLRRCLPLRSHPPEEKDLLPRLPKSLGPGLVQWSALTASCVIQSGEGRCIGRPI